MKSTIEAIERDLTSPAGYVYRYKDYDDGLGGAEGAFTICTFWLADDLIALGQISRPRRFSKSSGAAPMTSAFSARRSTARAKRCWGTFPQAFSHMALINTVIQLQKAGLRPRGTEATG